MKKIFLLGAMVCALGMMTGCTPDEEIQQWTVTVQSADNTMGYTSGTGVYDNNATATIKAIANQGYRFVMWDDSNTANPREVIVTSNMTFTALFDTISNNPNDDIFIVTLNHENPWLQWQDSIYQFTLSDNCVTGSGAYRSGTEVTISANNESVQSFGLFGNLQAKFSHWSDGDTNSTKSFTIASDCEYTAYYRLVSSVQWENENDNYIIGKWGKIGQYYNSFTLQYFNFYNNHTGVAWDEANDVTMSEGEHFTWQFDSNTSKLLVIFTNEITGMVVPREYDVITSASDRMFWIDTYGLASHWQKITSSN